MVCLELFVLHIASLCIGIQITTAQTSIEVNIPEYGRIQGSYTQPPGPAHQRVNRFLGIPYAKPPIGNRRFEPPESLDSWTQTRTATSFGSNCMQLNGADSVVGSEDCLYLNIYVPGSLSTRVDSPIPVLVFIHGVLPGQVNSGDDYIGDQLTIDDDGNPVILVSINYRFGVLGFATSGNNIIPGNMGYKDQAFAIKWVHDNIASFGGNTTAVTLFGQGSGGEAVKAHILSPENVDMFQRAIVQSGGPLWNYPNKMAHEQVFEDFGNHLGCMGDSTGIRDCLLGKTATSIVEVTSEDFQHLERLTKPVIDGQFMPRNPHEILMDGSYNAVDLMVGFNSDDGSTFATMYETDYPNFLSGVPANHASIDAALSGCLHAAVGRDQPQEMSRLLALIQDEYLEPAATNLENTRAVLDMVRDCMFVSHSLEMVEKFATDGQRTYVYVFNHRTDSLPDPAGQVAMAAPHAGELPYVFGTAARLDQSEYNSNEQIMSQAVMKAWYTFATSGAPTFHNLGYNLQTWTAYTPDSPMILSFDDESGNAIVSAETTWVPVSQFWAAVRAEEEEEGDTTEQPEAQAQSESSKEFKTDILGLDEFEADLAVILLAIAVLLLLFAVLVLLCKVCRCCDSKEEKYYNN